MRLRAESVTTLIDMRQTQSNRARLKIDADSVTDAFGSRLTGYLSGSAEGFPVEMQVKVPGYGVARIRLGDQFRLGADDDSVERVERLTGRGTVIFD